MSALMPEFGRSTRRHFALTPVAFVAMALLPLALHAQEADTPLILKPSALLSP